jgi:SAM-dependent methyltransferase
MKQAEWYVDWFNSPYYHLLYNNRSDDEAQLLIDNLCRIMPLRPMAKVWDMACGKGRHAIALSKKGLDVTGSDLSVNSIQEAQHFATGNLHFLVHDMLAPFQAQNFDLICNLFTSFGYFQNETDNFKVFENAAHSLKSDGLFLLDFFNAAKVSHMALPSYTEQRGELLFQIEKALRDKKIIKRIEFTDQGHDYYFEEKVSLLELPDFLNYAEAAGLQLKNQFGNYALEPFDENTSDRLILLFAKKQ